MWGSRKDRALTRTAGNFPGRRMYRRRTRQTRTPQSSRTDPNKMLRLVTVKSADTERCVCGTKGTVVRDPLAMLRMCSVNGPTSFPQATGRSQP